MSRTISCLLQAGVTAFYPIVGVVTNNKNAVGHKTNSGETGCHNDYFSLLSNHYLSIEKMAILSDLIS